MKILTARFYARRLTTLENPKKPTPAPANRYKETMSNPTPPAPKEDRFILDLPYTDDLIIAEIVRRSEAILGPQPRVHYPQGTHLTTEGERVRQVIFALEGSVALEHHSEAGEILMHHASTGRIIGLLGASDNDVAFFTSIATTPVTGVVVELAQLNQAMDADIKIAHLLTALFIRTLDRRLRRAEALHIEQAELADQLALERENLSNALHQLTETREEMAAQARFASLGELAAGVAHELNNPMAAIRRNADFLNEDVVKLLNTAPDRDWAQHALKSLKLTQEAPVLSTREVRRRKKEMEAATGDAALTQRLVMSGILDVDLARQLSRSGNQSVEVIEVAAAIGTNLRDMRTASQRIVDLVASLRSYARPDGDPIENVNLHDGLEDTLRLLNHRLHGVHIERDYGDIPAISCHPGQLAEVWTNVITNAVEAMTDALEPESRGGGEIGTITIRTQAIGITPAEEGSHGSFSRFGNAAARGEDTTNAGTTSYVGANHAPASPQTTPGPPRLRITFRDTGSGIPPEVLEHVFEPHFTTKGGEVRFGMGIGLGLVHTIIENHGGSIKLETVEEPRGTLVTVELPISGPRKSLDASAAEE